MNNDTKRHIELIRYEIKRAYERSIKVLYSMLEFLNLPSDPNTLDEKIARAFKALPLAQYSLEVMSPLLDALVELKALEEELDKEGE